MTVGATYCYERMCIYFGFCIGTFGLAQRQFSMANTQESCYITNDYFFNATNGNIT
jgi:hypothetical protein